MSEWREAKPQRAPGDVWSYKRGYRVNQAGRHENEGEYQAFRIYLEMQGGRSLDRVAEETGLSRKTVSSYYARFNWDRRVIAHDQAQTALAWREANKIRRNKHKEDIIEFRESQEKHARLMANVSERMLLLLEKRIDEAAANGEEIPMNTIASLLKAAAGVSEQSRQSWGTSLGVNEMIEAVENEIEKVEVEEITDDDPYDIPIEE